MTTQIKITQLVDIGANLTTTTVLPVVNMTGVPTTQKTNLGNVGNIILAGAGTLFRNAALANLAYSVTNAAQPNITSVGTLNINTLKISGGTTGQVLSTDGDGNLSWTTVSGGGGNGTPGGSNTQVQYNDAGDFGGDADFTYDAGNNILNVIRANVSYLTAYNSIIGDSLTVEQDVSGNGALRLQGIAGGNSTINIGGEADIDVVANIGNINLYTANNQPWIFDQDGNLTLPSNTFAVNYANGTQVPLGGGGGGAAGNAGDIQINVAGNIGADSTLRYVDNGGEMTLYADYLNAPGIFTSDIYAGDGTPSNITLTTNIGNATWTLDTTGNLSLPEGGSIYSEGFTPSGNPGNTITLNPHGSGSITNQKLLIYPTAGDGDHIHLTSGNLYQTELFLGSDNLFVKLANTGNIVINSDDDAGNTAQWTFSADGTLTFPDGGGIYNNGSTQFYGAPNSQVSFTDYEGYNQFFSYPGNGAGQGAFIQSSADLININTWQFGADGNLTLPGNLVMVGNTSVFGTDSALIQPSNNLPLLAISSGANGAVSSVWVEDIGNVGTSNIAAVYANPTPGSGIVRIAVGQNGGNAGPNLWDFNSNGTTIFPGDLIGSGASPAPSINGFSITNSVGISGNGNIAGNNISATGNITGAYFIGNGSQLTDVGVASVPSQNILPTIQSITIAATSNGGGGGGSGWANVTVANTIPVTEYGVIVTSGTISQKYVTGSLGSIPGTVQLNITTGLNTTPFTVYAYVTSNAGTYYSNSATGTSGICLLAGTQIALSDGSYKAIEDITYTDKMLSWDFDRGCYAETLALWIKRGETGSQYNLLTFSDGTTLRTFDQHRIFNKQAGAFTYPMTDATPIGTITVNEHGKEITLTNKQVIQDTIEYYNVITDYHMNLFSDSVLTSCRFNNIYPIIDMKFVKDARTLRTRDEFENVEDRFFNGLRLAEQTTDIETVEWYVNRLISTEVLTQSELTV